MKLVTSIVVIFLLIISSVSCESRPIDNVDSIPFDLSGMLCIDDSLYFSVQEIKPNTEKYLEIIDKLELYGSIKKSFEQYEIPDAEFSSNCLPIGTEIFIVGNDKRELYYLNEDILYPFEREDIYNQNNADTLNEN